MSLVIFGGCSATLGRLPRLEELDPAQGYKMLRPDSVATACRTEGPFAGREADLLEAALHDLLARDDEATAIVNGRVESTSWTIGVYGRRCVTLTADVVRFTPTVLLPMGGGHHGHEGR